jgi:hypothetical protein
MLVCVLRRLVEILFHLQETYDEKAGKIVNYAHQSCDDSPYHCQRGEPEFRSRTLEMSEDPRCFGEFRICVP